VEQGNNTKFYNAEALADTAGRLLRQSIKASQSQSTRGRRRRPRHRRGGDKYWGKNIYMGNLDLKKDYTVDKKYRQEIIDDIGEISEDDEHKSLLKNYLRRIIR